MLVAAASGAEIREAIEMAGVLVVVVMAGSIAGLGGVCGLGSVSDQEGSGRWTKSGGGWRWVASCSVADVVPAADGPTRACAGAGAGAGDGAGAGGLAGEAEDAYGCGAGRGVEAKVKVDDGGGAR